MSWLAWSRGDTDRADFWLGRWNAESGDHSQVVGREGAVEEFTIAMWACAVEALMEGRPEDARRFYERIHEVGSSFSTESHPAILWSMAASFFTPGG